MLKIFITGASEGIGKELAFKYSSKGAEVFLIARNEESLKQNCRQIIENGGNAHYSTCDVSKYVEIRAAVHNARDIMGKIDIAILNAGINKNTSIETQNLDILKNIFEVNVFGIAHGLDCMIPVMKSQGGGIIVGISSIAESRGFPGSSAYCASKAAATHLLESARIELNGTGIKIITVRPGFVRTKMALQNKFYMPLMKSTDKAADIIIKGIERGKERISFPLPLVFASYLAKIIPGAIIEPILSRWYKKQSRKQ